MIRLQEHLMSTSRTELSAVGLVVVLVAAPLLGQSPSESVNSISAQLAVPAKGFSSQVTPWGEPDLQGVWTSDAALGIPRERPAKFTTRAFLTDEEFAE